MKNLHLKRSFFILLIFSILLIIPAYEVDASIANAQMISGVDYSGHGTILNNKIRNGVAYNTTSYVYVPSYTGKYENQVILTNDWWLHSWSSWGTSNNRTNDYYTYRGESIVEYDVESKIQHLYRRYDPEHIPNYGTLYVTEYRGNKWYNSFLTRTETSTTGYPGSIANYDIVSRYTSSYIESYTGGYEYYGSWEDSQPSSSTNYSWQAYSSRTVYRYRSRNITWNSEYLASNEIVPLKYNLYDANGGSFDIAKWSFVPTISEYEPISGEGISMNLIIEQYYITPQAVVKYIDDNINAIQSDIDFLNTRTSGYWFAALTDIGASSGVSALLAAGELPGSLATVFALSAAIIEYSDILSIEEAANTIRTLADLIDYIIQEEDLVLVLGWECAIVHGVYESNMYESMYFQSSENQYVSMNFLENETGSAYLYPNQDNYGIVTFDHDASEVTNLLEEYLNRRFPRIYPWNW